MSGRGPQLLGNREAKSIKNMQKPTVRKNKGKRHPVHADSLIRIADDIMDIIDGWQDSALITVQDLRQLAKAILAEGKRVRQILR